MGAPRVQPSERPQRLQLCGACPPPTAPLPGAESWPGLQVIQIFLWAPLGCPDELMLSAPRGAEGWAKLWG